MADAVVNAWIWIQRCASQIKEVCKVMCVGVNLYDLWFPSLFAHSPCV